MVLWFLLQLFPQAADQTVGTAVRFFPDIRFSIDHVADLSIGIHTSWMPGHNCKDIKFPGSQQHLLFLHHNLTLERIQKKSRISDLLRLHVDLHTFQSLELSLDTADLRQPFLWKFNHHLSLQSILAPSISQFLEALLTDVMLNPAGFSCRMIYTAFYP